MRDHIRATVDFESNAVYIRPLRPEDVEDVPHANLRDYPLGIFSGNGTLKFCAATMEDARAFVRQEEAFLYVLH